MKLLTKNLIKKTPKLNAQESNADPKLYIKFVEPVSNWVWYVMEYDPKEKLFFGVVCGFDVEFGYFSLAELESFKNKLERDLSFKPCHLSELGLFKERSS